MRRDGGNTPRVQDLLAEIAVLRAERDEALETLRAIREGEVDAIVVSGSQGEQVFSLTGTEHVYRLIVETMKEAALTVTTDGTILFCNAQFGAFVQTPPERILGRPLAEFVASAYRELVASLLVRSQADAVKERLVFQGPEGPPVPAHVSATALCQADSLSLCLVAIDLTELEASAESLRRLREQEEMLRERTAALAAANKELESFSYSVSHDLRAPLRGIDGWSQALLEDYGGTLDEQGRTYLRTVRTETQRMGQLIDALLELARVTRAEMRCEAVDLSKLAREVAQELRRDQPGRVAEFLIAPGLVVRGDPLLLRAVLQNLLGNAWKFTAHHPGARIEVGVDHRDGRAHYFVRDNGVGFDMAYAAKLFVPFQRLHRQAEYPGTGVGLATVQRIIHRHGGRIWAEGAVGQGATFSFTL